MTGIDPSGMNDSVLEVLAHEVCLELLRENSVGRIAFDIEDRPVIFPVNYLLVEDETPWLMLRTKPGSELGVAPRRVGFEIDGIDTNHHHGWSVLVHGATRHITDQGLLELRDRPELRSWMPVGWNTWLAIEISGVTGRRLHDRDDRWAFDLRGYR